MPRVANPMEIPEIIIKIGHHIPLWTQLRPLHIEYINLTTMSTNEINNFSFTHHSTHNVSFTPKTLIACTQVSKQWRNLLLPLLWSHFEASFYPDSNIVFYKGKGSSRRERPTKNLTKAQAAIQATFREQAEETAKRRKELVKCGLKENCGLLRSARVVDGWGEDISPIVEGLSLKEEESHHHRRGRCVNLVDLTLLGSPAAFMQGPPPGQLLVRANPHLQRLDWNAGYTTFNKTLDARYFVGLTQLQSLRLELWTSPPGVLIQVLKAVAGSLKELVLGHVMRIDVIDFDVVVEGTEGQGCEGEGVDWVMPHLELLALQSCRPSPMVYLTNLVKHCPNLRALWTCFTKESTNTETTSRLSDSLLKYCPRFCSLQLGYSAPWKVIEPLVRHSFANLPLKATATTAATTEATAMQGGLQQLNIQITEGSDIDIVSSILLHAATMQNLVLTPFLGHESDLSAYQTLLSHCVSLKRFKYTVYKASNTERANQMKDEFIEQFFCNDMIGNGTGNENERLRWGCWRTLETLQIEGGVCSRVCRHCGGGICRVRGGHNFGGRVTGGGTHDNDSQSVQGQQLAQKEQCDVKDADEAIRGLLRKKRTFLGWSLAEYHNLEVEMVARKMDRAKLRRIMEEVQRQEFERLNTLILDGVVFQRPIRCRQDK